MRVPVETASGRTLGTVSPAQARMLMKQGVARRVDNPFRVQLQLGLDDVPLTGEETEMNDQTQQRRSNLSGPQAQPGQAPRQRFGGLNPLDAYLDQWDEVWIQNTGPTVISMEIESMSNPDSKHRLSPIPVGPDMYCLSEDVPLQTLRQSASMRAYLQKRYRDPFRPRHPMTGKALIRLVSPDEVEKYYTEKARSKGMFYPGTNEPDASAARREAEEFRQNRARVQEQHFSHTEGFAPPRTAMELAGLDMARRGITADGQHAFGGMGGMLPAGAAQQMMQMQASVLAQMGVAPPVQASAMYIQDAVTPQVLHLCTAADTSIEGGHRMPAEDFVRQLTQLELSLTEADLDYIMAHGVYVEVKRWAQDQMRRRFSANEQLPADVHIPGFNDQRVAEQLQQQQRAAMQFVGQVPLSPQQQSPQPVGLVDAYGRPIAAPAPAMPTYQGPTGFVNAPVTLPGARAEGIESLNPSDPQFAPATDDGPHY